MSRTLLPFLFYLACGAATISAWTFVAPGAYDFDPSSAYFNDMEYNETNPLNGGVYFAQNDSDVGEALKNATATFKTIVARSAGHSYVSLGAAMPYGQAIIDTSNISAIGDVFIVPCDDTSRRDPDGQCRAITVGPGARLYDFYTHLYNISMIFPGGSCPTVGMGGYTLGGGIGFWGRWLGYGTDALYDFSLWTKTLGEVINLNRWTTFEDKNVPRDLVNPVLWALSGGGNNNFGVVSNLTVRVWQQPPQVAQWVVNSTEPAFCQELFFSRWQIWNWQSDERLWAQFKFSNPFYNITGISKRMFNGVQLPHWQSFAESQASCQITFILMNATNATELYDMLMNASSWNFEPILSKLTPNTPYPTLTSWYEQICGGTLCDDLQRPWQEHWTQGTYSAYRFEDMSETEVANLFTAMQKAPNPNVVQSFVLFDSLGGQFARGTGSLPWHNAHYHAQILYYLYPTGDRTLDGAGWTWAQGVGQVLDGSTTSGASYSNYPDWNYASPQYQLQRYYGGNLPYLQKLKLALDPLNLFPSTAGVNLNGKSPRSAKDADESDEL